MTSNNSQAFFHGINQGHHPVLHPSRWWHLWTLTIYIKSLVEINRTLTHEIGFKVEKAILPCMLFWKKQVIKQRTFVEFACRRNQSDVNVIGFFKETINNLSRWINLLIIIFIFDIKIKEIFRFLIDTVIGHCDIRLVGLQSLIKFLQISRLYPILSIHVGDVSSLSLTNTNMASIWKPSIIFFKIEDTRIPSSITTANGITIIYWAIIDENNFKILICLTQNTV